MTMGGLLHNIIFFVIAIGVLVTFHEFGHYWTARLLKVKVLRFSVGFGKPLFMWTRKKGEDVIEYAVAAIPLGGYVKMLDERESNVRIDEKDLPRAFNRQPVFNRILIVAAGPVFNFILAIVLYWFVFMGGVEGRRPLMATPEMNTPAAQAGFREEDQILAVAGTEVKTWQEFRLALIDYGIDGGDLPIRVKTADELLTTRILQIGDRHILDDKADVLDQLGFDIWRPQLAPIIGGVTPDGAARRDGLVEGDRITAVDGRSIENWEQLVEVIEASPDKPLQFQLQRDGQQVDMTVTPGVRKKNDRDSGVIGAYQYVPEETIEKIRTRVDYGPVEAATKAVEKTWSMSVLTLRVLGKMLLGEAALENISGPITIATYAGMTASIGITTYLSFLAIISVSLGVLNLLPVPMLDGGHLLYYLIELVKGSPVSERFEELGQQVGLALLIMLMGLAIFNDIQRLIN